MNPADSADENNGRVVKITLDYWAFLPNPLLPMLALTWELVNQLSEADRALSQSRRSGPHFAEPALVSRSFYPTGSRPL